MFCNAEVCTLASQKIEVKIVSHNTFMTKLIATPLSKQPINPSWPHSSVFPSKHPKWHSLPLAPTSQIVVRPSFALLPTPPVLTRALWI